VHHFEGIHFLHLFCLHYSCTVRENAWLYNTPIWFWVIHSVLCMFWLVLSYDLLKDRHIDDDDGPQFKFHSCMISLNLSEWLLICKATNECASFCMDKWTIDYVKWLLSQVSQNGGMNLLASFWGGGMAQSVGAQLSEQEVPGSILSVFKSASALAWSV